jgi:hypothetical protein
MKNTAHLSPERLRTLQLGSVLIAGVCIPVLGSALVQALLLVSFPVRGQTWRDLAGVGVQIITAMLIMVISYRLVRRSTLPGVATIGLLMALAGANVFLNR